MQAIMPMPDDKSWIKLYRKIKDNDIVNDLTALGLFVFLLISADRTTGQYTTGRNWLATHLKQHPSRIYRLLKKLEKKYQVISIKSNNRFSTISIVKWHFYQEGTNNNRTSSEHLANNNRTLNKNKRIRELENNPLIVPPKKYSSLEDLKDEDITDIASAYKVPVFLVKAQHEQLKNYCESSGHTYKNYKAALRNFVIRAATDAMNRPQQRGGVLDATDL